KVIWIGSKESNQRQVSGLRMLETLLTGYSTEPKEKQPGIRGPDKACIKKALTTCFGTKCLEGLDQEGQGLTATAMFDLIMKGGRLAEKQINAYQKHVT